MKTKWLGAAACRWPALNTLTVLLYTVSLLAITSPANAETNTYTDKVAYLSAAGPQSSEDFNSPQSSTANSMTFPNLLYVCSLSSIGFCFTADGQGGLAAFVTTPGVAVFTFNSPIASFGISIMSSRYN